jgi:hypothetical protein
MAVRFWAIRALRALSRRSFLVLIFVRGWVEPRTIVLLKGLGKFKIKWPYLESNPGRSGLWHNFPIADCFVIQIETFAQFEGAANLIGLWTETVFANWICLRPNAYAVGSSEWDTSSSRSDWTGDSNLCTRGRTDTAYLVRNTRRCVRSRNSVIFCDVTGAAS